MKLKEGEKESLKQQSLVIIYTQVQLLKECSLVKFSHLPCSLYTLKTQKRNFKGTLYREF